MGGITPPNRFLSAFSFDMSLFFCLLWQNFNGMASVEVEHVGAVLVNHHAAISLPNFAETTFDKPACSIVTPYMTSAISIVRLL